MSLATHPAVPGAQPFGETALWPRTTEITSDHPI